MTDLISYNARMIDQGRVTNHATLQAANDLQAYSLAHDGVDALLGSWVEIRRTPKPPKRIDPAKLAPKTDALRESFSPEQGNGAKDLSCAPSFQPVLPKPAGYMPSFKKSIME